MSDIWGRGGGRGVGHAPPCPPSPAPLVVVGYTQYIYYE